MNSGDRPTNPTAKSKMQGKQPAKEMVENTLKSLDDNRKVRDEQRRKHRMEAQADAKKAKKQKQ